ncbi:MAG: TIGR04282 family arsenosugar biosynthesis glycosyltransferase [Proteobacteria bacterium]|nr:TIGR04282 family arsenosugar biosynthesis glycosyltransferase [Pseudomonadota bacterium]
MAPIRAEPVAIAILAKAPVAGIAKTRLAPAIGAQRAASLQARCIDRALTTAIAARVGAVTLWMTPDEHRSAFAAIIARHNVRAMPQPDGDLGARMHGAVVDAGGPVLVMGTDCPALCAAHLCTAADALRGGDDAVFIPVEDGGYALVGLRAPAPGLFADMAWSTATVMAETRQRLRGLDLRWRELETLWDIDLPADLARLHAAGFSGLLE